MHVSKEQHIFTYNQCAMAHQEQQSTIPLAKGYFSPFVSSWLCNKLSQSQRSCAACHKEQKTRKQEINHRVLQIISEMNLQAAPGFP